MQLDFARFELSYLQVYLARVMASALHRGAWKCSLGTPPGLVAVARESAV